MPCRHHQRWHVRHAASGDSNVRMNGMKQAVSKGAWMSLKIHACHYEKAFLLVALFLPCVVLALF